MGDRAHQPSRHKPGPHPLSPTADHSHGPSFPRNVRWARFDVEMAFRQQEEMELQQAQEEAELLQQEDPFGNRHRRQFVGVPPRAEARAAWA